MEDATGRNDRSAGIGWGVGSGDEADDLGPRRILFAVLCSMVVLIGAVFMYDSVRHGGRSEKRTMMAAQGRYAIQLCVVDESQSDIYLDVANALLKDYDIEAEACERELEDADGKVAICVGRFQEADSQQAARLVERLAAFTSSKRKLRPFKNAHVIEVE
jgi:hypothetical protein